MPAGGRRGSTAGVEFMMGKHRGMQWFNHRSPCHRFSQVYQITHLNHWLLCITHLWLSLQSPPYGHSCL